MRGLVGTAFFTMRNGVVPCATDATPLAQVDFAACEESLGGVLRARCILVVDDDPDQVAMLALLLREAGYRVETATNPLYALTLAAEFSADVVFLDIGLPVMNGYEVLLRLKKYFPRARFYAITGRAQEETRNKAMEAGFDGYFVKPLDFSNIENALQHQ